jgi:hypothetical protein
LSKEGLAKIAEKVNRFFYSSELKQEKGELVDIQHVLSQPLYNLTKGKSKLISI